MTIEEAVAKIDGLHRHLDALVSPTRPTEEVALATIIKVVKEGDAALGHSPRAYVVGEDGAIYRVPGAGERQGKALWVPPPRESGPSEPRVLEETSLAAVTPPPEARGDAPIGQAPAAEPPEKERMLDVAHDVLAGAAHFTGWLEAHGVPHADWWAAGLAATVPGGWLASAAILTQNQREVAGAWLANKGAESAAHTENEYVDAAVLRSGPDSTEVAVAPLAAVPEKFVVSAPLGLAKWFVQPEEAPADIAALLSHGAKGLEEAFDGRNSFQDRMKGVADFAEVMLAAAAGRAVGAAGRWASAKYGARALSQETGAAAAAVETDPAGSAAPQAVTADEGAAARGANAMSASEAALRAKFGDAKFEAAHQYVKATESGELLPDPPGTDELLNSEEFWDYELEEFGQPLDKATGGVAHENADVPSDTGRAVPEGFWERDWARRANMSEADLVRERLREEYKNFDRFPRKLQQALTHEELLRRFEFNQEMVRDGFVSSAGEPPTPPFEGWKEYLANLHQSIDWSQDMQTYCRTILEPLEMADRVETVEMWRENVREVAIKEARKQPGWEAVKDDPAMAHEFEEPHVERYLKLLEAWTKDLVPPAGPPRGTMVH